MARRWTKREAQNILMGAGAFGVSWLRAQTKGAYSWPGAPKRRSYHAVMCKAWRMGLGGVTRGSMSLADVCKRTGYTKTLLMRAMSALNQKWKRTGKRGDYLITDDQLDEMLDWLKHDYWSKAKRLYACSWCSASNRPHEGLGLCCSCFWKHLKLCKRLGVPTGIESQLGLWVRLKRLVWPDTGDDAKLLARLGWRLNKRLALDRVQLTWFAVQVDQRLEA
jgi:hypothetical protein